jgi:hypothetical protein
VATHDALQARRAHQSLHGAARHGDAVTLQLRISAEVDHPFRVKPITCFARSRSPVSGQADHLFRSKPIRVMT